MITSSNIQLKQSTLTRISAAVALCCCLVISIGCGAGGGSVSPSSPSTPTTPPSTPPSSTHSVAISWQPSNSSGVAGYYVYSRTATAALYDKLLTPTPVTANSFTDQTVKSGDHLFYIVTAVDTAGTQSMPSNEVEVTIP